MTAISALSRICSRHLWRTRDHWVIVGFRNRDPKASMRSRSPTPSRTLDDERYLAAR